MDEWKVVLVIAALVSLFAAVLAPIVKLNNLITRLASAVEHLERNLSLMDSTNTNVHNKLERDIDGLKETANDHETRISILERTD